MDRQLNRIKLSRCGRGPEVCFVGAALPAKPQEFVGQHGKTLLRRLSRLDSELEMSRADLGARGNPWKLIAITGDRFPIPEPGMRVN